MKRVFLALVLSVLVGGCSCAGKSTAALEAHGFTEIQTTGWAPFSCSDSDAFSTGFVATNPRGQRVEGVVCCGLLMKDCTVRF